MQRKHTVVWKRATRSNRHIFKRVFLSFIYTKVSIDSVCGLMMVWRLSESFGRKLGAHATSSNFLSENKQISQAGV